MSSVRGSAGSPCTVISRYDACSLDAHCAVTSPGTLTQGVSIGRSGEADVRIEDKFASQIHARVYPRGGSYYVEDMGSTNGTYLNGMRLGAPAVLRPGDQLQVGNTVLEAA